MATKKTNKSSKVVKKTHAVSKKTTKSVKKVEKTKAPSKKNNGKSVLVLLAIAVIIILAVFIAIFSNRNSTRTLKSVETINELTATLNVKMKEPKNVEDVSYSIENDDIARMEYKKKVTDGSTMDFVLKSSSATEENITGLKNTWGTKIIMTVICDDESDIEVESYVATDNPKIMKSEWYDNDLYYSMATDNLVTREDFLQEVNRVIIDNHIEFD